MFVTSFICFPSSSSAQLCHQFDFIADEASFVWNDCGNIHVGLWPGFPDDVNIIEITSNQIIVSDLEGSGPCTGLASDSGGDLQNYWTSLDIDVSGKCQVEIEATYSFDNLSVIPNSVDLECNCSCDGEDYLGFEYSVDGGLWQFFDPSTPNEICNNDTGTGHIITSPVIIGASDIAIRLQLGAQAVTEAIIIDGITINEVPSGLTAMAGAISTTVCSGQDIELEETGSNSDDWSWSWSGSAGFNSTMQNPTVSGTSLPGTGNHTYFVTVTDINGCTATDEIDIFVTGDIAANANAGDTEVCIEEDIFLSETSGNGDMWLWDGPNGFSSTLQNPIVSGTDLPGEGFHDYIVTITDVNGCSGTDVVEIEVTAEPAALANAAHTMVCDGDDIELMEMGGDAEEWSWSGPGFSSGFQNPVVIDPLLPGPGFHTYTVTITDDNECSSTSDLDITVTPEPTAIAESGSSFVCFGSDILLFESGTGGDSWSWDGPNAYVSTNQNPIVSGPDLPGEGDHSYFVTVTDTNNCTAESSVDLTVGSSVTATLTTPAGGDVIVCEGECATDDFIIELEITGGTPPYTVDLEVAGIFAIPLPNPIDISQTFIQICNGPFGIDANSDPIEITLPDFAFSGFSLGIDNVVDDTGCAATGGGGVVELILQDKPDIDPPTVVVECLTDGQLIDLTQYDNEIGSGADVVWLETEDVDDLIGTPANYDINDGDLVYASVSEDPCFSDIIPVQLEFLLQPEITIVVPRLFVCGNELELPDIDDVATIENEASPQYYTDMDFSRPGQNPTAIITVPDGVSEIFLYDESGDNCSDFQVIEVESLSQPEIVSPSGTFSSCGSILLPDPEILNDDDVTFEYNTEPDGTGDAFFEDDEIEESDGISMLFLIATNDTGPIPCVDTTQIKLDFLGGQSFTASIPSQLCDTLFLPQITPASPTVAYFTSVPNGQTLLPGDTITFNSANAGVNPLDTLFLFDPTQTGLCSVIDTLVFEIGQTPILDVPFVNQFCDEGFLPPPSANNPNLEYANNRDFNPSSILNPSMPITSSTQIYFRDSIPFSNGGACYALDSFFLEIIDVPDPGQDSTITICEGLASVFDINELLNITNLTGQLETTSTVDISNPQNIVLTSLPTGTHTISNTIDISGCPAQTATLTIIVEDPPNPGDPINQTVCSEQGIVDLPTLINPDPGGEWVVTNVSNDRLTIPDLTMWDISTLDAGDYTVTYSIDEMAANPFCEAQSSTSIITIAENPNAGVDGIINVCAGFDRTVNLFEILSNPDTDGLFTTSINVPDLEITDPTAVDLSVLAESSFNIEYTIEKAGCPIAASIIEVNVSAAPFAGTPFDVTICRNESEVDLTALLTDADPGGAWFATTASQTMLPITNPSQYDITSIIGDNATITYIIENSDPTILCDRRTSTSLLNLDDAPNAGDDSDVTICRGEAIDLNTILSTDADAGGQFLQDGFDVFDPLNWEPISINPQVTITYILESLSANCPSDTATILVNISDMLDAGTPITTLDVCEGEEILLSDRIDGESPGGDFFLASDLSSPINDSYIPTVDETFAYIIEGSSSCDPDTTEFSIVVNDAIDIITTFSGTDICADSGDCVEINIQSNKQGDYSAIIVDVAMNTNSTEISIPVQPGVTNYLLCPSDEFNNPSFVQDTFFFGPNDEILVDLQSFEDETQICTSVRGPSETIRIRDNFLLEIDTTVCPGSGVEIGGQLFFSSFRSDEFTSFGCDSTVILTLNEFAIVPESVERTLCTGQTFDEIPGFLFDSNLDTMVTLTSASSMGCDSIIMLSLQFQDVTIGTMDINLCTGDFVIVDGVRIDETMPSADIPSPIISAFGCDSITSVTATILPLPDIGDEARDICSTESFTLGDITYDANNLTGLSTLEDGSAAGCDSMVNVTVTLIQEVFDLPIELCANESIIIGGNTYDINNTMGTSNTGETSSLGCDSIVMVMVDIIPLDEREINLALCEDMDITIGNETFNFSNPSGEATTDNGTDCDSLFIVEITELRKDTTTIELDFCEDMDTIINGITYNTNNTMGASTLTNTDGCDSLVIVDLFIGATVATIDVINCPGDNMGQLTITDTEGLSLPLTVEIPDLAISEIISSLPAVINVTSGNYLVTLDDGQCTYSEQIDVSPDGSSIAISADPLTESTWQLGVMPDTGIIEYSWTSEGTLDCNNCPAPILSSTIEAQVSVEVTLDSGCIIADNITLIPEETVPDSIIRIYLPTSIVIGDPQNESFFPQSNFDFEVGSMAIYDRWGELLFLEENFMSNMTVMGWDGRSDGQDVEQGVYVYLLRYDDPILGEQLRSGTLTVVR